MDEKKTAPEVEAPGREATAIDGAVVVALTNEPTYIGKNCVITTETITPESLKRAGVDDEIKFEAL